METHLKILVVDDEPNIRKLVAMSLENDHHKVSIASNVSDALKLAAQHPFDIAFVDLRLGTDTGLDLIPELLAESPWLGIVVITAYATIDTAVEAISPRRIGLCAQTLHTRSAKTFTQAE